MRLAAPPGPAGGAIALPPDRLAVIRGKGLGKGKERVGNKGGGRKG